MTRSVSSKSIFNLLGAGETEGVLRRGRFQDMVPFQNQDVLGQLAQIHVVLDHQDGLALGRRHPGFRSDVPRILGHGVGHAGDVHGEGRALLQNAVHAEIGPQLLQDPVNGRQAQARSAAFALGREKRFEDARKDVGRYAASRVPYRDADVLAGIGLFALAEIILVQVFAGHFDPQGPAPGHGVLGIDGQIHEDLLYLALIGLDLAQARWHDRLPR